LLRNLNVRAEAFGSYFDGEGKVVYKTGSLGIKINDLKNIDMVVALGGGISKAEPMVLVNRGRSNNVIVTDEVTAREIYNILQLQGGN
jgi:central glycolytic genes regulator